MTTIGMKIFAAFAAFGAMLWLPAAVGTTTRPREEPHIVSKRPGADRCAEGDPLGPCPSQFVTIENPLRKRVDCTLSCGQDLERPVVTVDGRTRAEFELDARSPGGTDCSLESWKAR